MNTQSAFGVKLGANGRNNSQHCWPNNVSATTPNNTQQTDATCNIQRCWELVANDVASLWPGYAIIANYLNTLKPLLSGHSPNSLLSVHGHFVVPVGILRCHGADGNGNKNAIKAVGCKQQNKNCAREAHFLVHFFSVTARLRRENAQFHHSYLSGMVLETRQTPLLYVVGNFIGTDRAQRSIDIPIILNLLANRNIALIYSVNL